MSRTDLHTGNLNVLLTNINEKPFILPSDFMVLSDHGPRSTIAHEKVNNPFLRFGEVY